MAEQTSSSGTGPARRARRVSTRTAGRRTRAGGAELITNLNTMIEELIKENRKLRRQVDRLSAKGTAAASSTVERGLRTIQRRVQRALGATASSGRRRSSTGATGRRGATTTTGRKTTTTRTRRSSGSS